MAFFKINNIDFSMYVNSLKVESNVNYTAQTNAAGNTVVDYINTKREIEVGIIPLNDEAMKALQAVISAFNVSVSFLNPNTATLEESVNCIIPKNGVEYYTIQNGNVSFKQFTIKLIEL